MFPLEAQRWLARATGIAARNLRANLMRGATSSTLWLLSDARDEKRHFVLRVFNNREWLDAEPDLPRHEIAALNEAQRAGIHAPEPIAFCENSALFGAPAVLMSYVHGEAQLQPVNFNLWLNELATTLANLHRHRAPKFAWQYQSWVAVENLVVPKWTQAPHLWARAFELWQSGAPAFEPVFIHRDYHPLNVLWQNQRISGVVDWPNACRGPAGVDVAHCRGNLMLLFGVEAADEFLRAYLQRSQRDYQVFWDVDGLLDFCLPRPEWYRPWSEFGLSALSDDTLQKRAEVFLESVLARV